MGPLLQGLNTVECQEECDKDPRCNNIKYCDNGCTLYSGSISENSDIGNFGDEDFGKCRLSFKTCPGGTKTILPFI